MAVKVFCNQCQKFIKDAELNEMKKLTGEEICLACQTYNKSAFDEVDKLRRETVSKVNKICNDVQLELDNAIRRVLRNRDDE